LNSNVYAINGTYNDGSTFESYLVSELNDTPQGFCDDDIFFFGLSRDQAIKSIGIEGTDFTVTKVHDYQSTVFGCDEFDKWFNAFQPYPNPNSDGSGYVIDDVFYMYETFGDDLMTVVDIANSEFKDRLWTVFESDNGLRITNGYYYPDCFGFFITNNPAKNNVAYDVKY